MLLYMFNKHNEDFRKMVGHGRSMKSLRRYEVVYRHLRSFIRTQYHLEDIRVKYVTIKLIHAFEQYLRIQAGLKNNTVWVYMITFKHIVSWPVPPGSSAPTPSLHTRTTTSRWNGDT